MVGSCANSVDVSPTFSILKSFVFLLQRRMFRHKSLGLLTGLIVAPRLGYRLFNAAKVSILQIQFIHSVAHVRKCFTKNSFMMANEVPNWPSYWHWTH